MSASILAPSATSSGLIGSPPRVAPSIASRASVDDGPVDDLDAGPAVRRLGVDLVELAAVDVEGNQHVPTLNVGWQAVGIGALAGQMDGETEVVVVLLGDGKGSGLDPELRRGYGDLG